MSVFVVLALTLAVLAVGMVVVGGLQAWAAVKRLLATVDQQAERLRPLADELQSELAVAGTELDAIQARRQAHERSRQQRQHSRGA